MKNNKNMFNMVLTAIFSTIVFVLGMIPNVGFIQILPGVAITIVHIPVIIGLFILPLSSSLFLGFIFGLSSLIVAATLASSPFDLAFINPLISILPRMLFALIGHYILVLFKKIIEFKYSKHTIFLIITIVTSFGLYFGVQEVVKNVTYSKVTDTQTEILVLESLKVDDEYTWTQEDEDKLDLLITNLPTYQTEADNKYPNIKNITTYILIAIILVIIIVYVYLVYYSKYSEKYFYVPSVFILSTFIHTILVILAVIVIQPALFVDALNNNSVIEIILGIALTNGLVEAIFAAFIGTPIVVATINRMED